MSYTLPEILRPWAPIDVPYLKSFSMKYSIWESKKYLLRYSIRYSIRSVYVYVLIYIYIYTRIWTGGIIYGALDVSQEETPPT